MERTRLQNSIGYRPSLSFPNGADILGYPVGYADLFAFCSCRMRVALCSAGRTRDHEVRRTGRSARPPAFGQGMDHTGKAGIKGYGLLLMTILADVGRRVRLKPEEFHPLRAMGPVTGKAGKFNPLLSQPHEGPSLQRVPPSRRAYYMRNSRDVFVAFKAKRILVLRPDQILVAAGMGPMTCHAHPRRNRGMDVLILESLRVMTGETKGRDRCRKQLFRVRLVRRMAVEAEARGDGSVFHLTPKFSPVMAVET